jgi:hypothetical protein
MIPVEKYEEKVLKKNREKRLKEISVEMDKWKKRHMKETINIDIAKVIREIREDK